MDVFGLQSFGTLLDVELDALAFVQRPIPLSLDGAVMNEHVFTSLTLDETKAFVVVEPLNGTNLRHFNLQPGNAILPPHEPAGRQIVQCSGPFPRRSPDQGAIHADPLVA